MHVRTPNVAPFLCSKFVEQGLGIYQVGGVEALGEPSFELIYRSLANKQTIQLFLSSCTFIPSATAAFFASVM